MPQETVADRDPGLGEFDCEYSADRGRLGVQLGLWAVLLVLLTVGIAVLVIRPAGNYGTALLTALVLSLFLPLLIALFRHDWKLMRRRIRLHEHGLDVLDGDQSIPIPWKSVGELYEVVSSKKMYGITTDAPHREVTLVTDDGFRCAIDDYVVGGAMLASIVAEHVVASLRTRAAARLGANQDVRFGALSVSAAGIVIAEPEPKSFPANLGDWFARTTGDVVVQPGKIKWEKVRDIRVAKRKKDQETYFQVEIRRRGSDAPSFVMPVPRFPNFAIFREVLDTLKHPLGGEE